MDIQKNQVKYLRNKAKRKYSYSKKNQKDIEFIKLLQSER